MNATGVLIALFTAIVIGFGFIWVIKLEYYVGAHVAKAIAALGVAVSLTSLFISNFILSAMAGIVGGTIVWGAVELPDQEKRVAMGLFPSNPRKCARKLDKVQAPSRDHAEGGES